MHFSILSDLKKTTAVVESLSTTSTRCSVPEITTLLQDKQLALRPQQAVELTIQEKNLINTACKYPQGLEAKTVKNLPQTSKGSTSISPTSKEEASDLGWDSDRSDEV